MFQVNPLGCLACSRPLYRRREGACRFFDFFDIRPLRGGAGRGSTARCRCELDVRFFFRARSELGPPFVAVRGGVQLRSIATSSISAFFEMSSSKNLKRITQGRAACGAYWSAGFLHDFSLSTKMRKPPQRLGEVGPRLSRGRGRCDRGGGGRLRWRGPFGGHQRAEGRVIGAREGLPRNVWKWFEPSALQAPPTKESGPRHTRSRLSTRII